MPDFEKRPDVVSYIVFESSLARAERSIKRLWIALIIAIIAIFAVNGCWLWYLNQYDFASTSYEYEQDGEGLNIIGDKNGVNFNEPTNENYTPN